MLPRVSTALSRDIVFAASWLFVYACGNPSSETDEPIETTGSETGDVTGGVTGEPTGGPGEICDPALEPIPEADFAERFASAICEQKASCGCETDFACETSFLMELEAVRSYSKSAGLVYDGVCASTKILGMLEQHGCQMASEITLGPTCAFDCNVYRGMAGEGEECTLFLETNSYLLSLFVDPCAEPASCSVIDQICRPPLPVVEEGQPCRDEASRTADCGGETYCDVYERVCTKFVEQGGSCVDHACSSLDSYCSEAKTCTPKEGVGGSCTEDAQCRSGRCGDGACADFTWICDVDEMTDLAELNSD